MKTYSLKTREEIRDAVRQALMIEEMEDYADTLVGYFWGKMEAWMTAVRNTHTDTWEKVAEREYGTQTGKPRYELETAMDDLKTVLRWREEIDHYVDCAVAQEMANPTEVEYEFDEDENEARANYLMTLEDKYYDTVRARDLMGLYGHTAGMDKYTKEEFHELFLRYDCGL